MTLSSLLTVGVHMDLVPIQKKRKKSMVYTYRFYSECELEPELLVIYLLMVFNIATPNV